MASTTALIDLLNHLLTAGTMPKPLRGHSEDERGSGSALQEATDAVRKDSSTKNSTAGQGARAPREPQRPGGRSLRRAMSTRAISAGPEASVALLWSGDQKG